MLDKNHDNTKTLSPLQLTCYGLLLLATIAIFSIAQIIQSYLISYDLNSMYISFCVGFILFTPLVSLLLYPLVITKKSNERSYLAILLTNAGLVLVVQSLFFLIWMTDAIAVYSIYVDQNSFLAKAFNITNDNHRNLTTPFYWGNLFLAWFFALLSLVIGIMPCLIARIDDKGVVKNFVAAFSFAWQYKIRLVLAALCIATATVLPLLYSPYLFLLTFPCILTAIVFYLSRLYFSSK
jgi:hypothetical protein